MHNQGMSALSLTAGTVGIKLRVTLRQAVKDLVGKLQAIKNRCR
jgi:hypothetical protein